MKTINFVNYIDGDVLITHEDGIPKDNGILVKFSLSASCGHEITINGIKAIYDGNLYTAQVLVNKYKNIIKAVDNTDKSSESIVIYWFKNAYKTYRLGVDDVIKCFENIYHHRNEYTTIFDDPFLAVFKELHNKYNTPVHMHIYYQNDDGSFNLTMFPDKYKSEFIENSDWLKFTFHALSDKPDSPYKYATYEKVQQDGNLVINEIRRFAGEEVFSEVTSQHWADSNLEATRGFCDLGYKCIDGYFRFDNDGNPYVSYYLNREQVNHISKRDFWVDTNEDIIFVKDDMVIDTVPLDKIESFIENISFETGNSFHYLLIHEQYFYEHYFSYQSDYKEKLFKAIDNCHRLGYRPTAMSSIIFE